MPGFDSIGWIRFIYFWRRNKGSVVALSFILLLVMVFATYWERNGGSFIKDLYKKETAHASSTETVYKAIAEGDYDSAISQVERKLNEDPDSMHLKDLWSQLMDELKIDFTFNYLPGQKKHITTRSLSTGLKMTSKDPYYLMVHASHKCYLYILQKDSSGNVFPLFSNPEFVSISNPVPPGPLRIPEGFKWFYLDNVPGIETIYVLASRWKNKKLEELISRVGSEKDVIKKRELAHQILSRLKVEEKATDKVPGLVYGIHQFIHNEQT